MASGHKVYFIIMEIVAQLLFFTGIRAGEVRPSDNATNRKSLEDPSIDCLFVFYASFVVRFDRSLTSIGGMTTLLDAMRHSLVGAQE